MKLIELLNYPGTTRYTLDRVMAINLPDQYHVTDYEYSLNKLILFRNDKPSLNEGDRIGLIQLSSIQNKNLELYYYNKDIGDRIPRQINRITCISGFSMENSYQLKINLD